MPTTNELEALILDPDTLVGEIRVELLVLITRVRKLEGLAKDLRESYEDESYCERCDYDRDDPDGSAHRCLRTRSRELLGERKRGSWGDA